jgi:iron complex outermembrane receptor protein
MNKQITHGFQRSLLSVVIAGLTGISAPVWSQAEGMSLEEVVVTAQRREQSLQDTPISITAFTTDKLTELGIRDLTQMADFAPNVSIQTQPASNAHMGVRVRGVGSGEVSLLSDPKVGIYIDGVFLSRTTGAVFDIADLERIEVLRGPQGTLFGRNATGGAINVTTQKPTGELAVKIEGSVGNYGYSRIGGTVDLPSVANVAAKLTAFKVEKDGWADNNYKGEPTGPLDKKYFGDKPGEEENKAYRLALRWTPMESLTVDYAYDKTDNEGVSAPFQVTKVKDSLYNGFTETPTPFTFLGGELFQGMADLVGDPDKRRDEFDLDSQGREFLEVEGHNLTLAWELDNLTLKYILGDRETKTESWGGADFDSGAFTARDLFLGDFAGNSGPVPKSIFTAHNAGSTVEMTSHEFQIIGNFFNDRLIYTGGLYLYEDEVFQPNPQTYSLPIEFILADPAAAALRAQYDAFGYCAPETGSVCTGTQVIPFDPEDVGDPQMVDFEYGQKTDSMAVYGQASFDVTDALEMTLGLRYTEDEKEAFLYNQNIPESSQDAPIRADDEWDNLSYLANLSYRINDDVNVYLRYATGYNSGGFPARASNAASFVDAFEEEEAETWELGLKSEWLERTLRLNVAIFTNDFTDMQIDQFEAGTGGASSRVVNAGSSTLQGVEVDMVWLPLQGLTIDANYGYLDASFDEYMARNPATDQLEDISSVTTMPQAPENSASLGVQYDFEPFSFGALSMRADVAYTDEFVFHPFQNQYNSADERTLVNGRISLSEIPLGSDAGNLRLSLWGKNLTDEEYVDWGIDFSSFGFAGVVFGEPRTYGLDVVYSYD